MGKTNNILGKTILLLSSFGLLGCGNEAVSANNAPSVVGVKDVQCIVNTEIDFLDGVAALDKEDGDITPKLEISVSPHVDVDENFHATFDKEGEYTVTYSITDSQGRTGQKRSYVDVISREKYVSFDMPIGYYAEHSGKAEYETVGMVNGEFLVKAKGHEVAEDIKINKVFKLKTNLQYTFKFKVDSRCEGKVKALADGKECGEMKLEKGKGKELSFKHIVLDKTAESRDVEISLCFGGILDKSIDLTILDVELEFPQEAGKIVNLTEGFLFSGRVSPRFDGCIGNAWSTEDGSQGVVEVTETNLTDPGDMYRGGMFINTGVDLKPGVTYTISFDVKSEKNDYFPDEIKNYRVNIQRGQWNEYKFETIDSEEIEGSEDGHVTRDIVVDDISKGALWLYVESGTQRNNIKMSNLRVEEHLLPTGKESYPISDFVEEHNSAFPAHFQSNLGTFTYDIERFAANDGDQKVVTPAFFISGSSGNYVLSFKAKASSPIEVVCAAPVAGGWDPTLMWSRLYLNSNEQAFAFPFNTSAADRDYTIAWQFGSTNNQVYHDVHVEISDISISLRNAELDK